MVFQKTYQNWLSQTTERFKVLDKLNLCMVVWFYAQVNFNIAPAALKNNAQFKSGQVQLKNNTLVSFI